MKMFKNTGPGAWIQGGIYGLLLLGIYFDTLVYLVQHDWLREDYSYGYLIPFVVLYLIWDRRERLFALPSRPSWAGFVLVGLAVFLFWIGELGGEYLSLYISLWLMITGLLWVHLGWRKLRELFFSLVMLFTMFPLPNFLYTKISWQLKLISSQLGVAMMQAVGMSAFREGNVIDLGFTQLQVVDACSGLRYLIPLIVLGLLLAYFFKAPFWKRAVVVISTVPLSIITNSLRIALTGVLYERWGAAVAEGFFHGFSGWFIFLVSLGVLLLLMWALNGFKSSGVRGQRSEDGDRGEVRRRTTNERNGVVKGRGKGRLGPQFWVAAVLLIATLVFSYGIEFREKTPISRPFDQFPVQVGEWAGTRQVMEKEIIDTLDLSDYVMITYENRSGRHVDFYVAYYESQRKGESIHTPETCLPGSGWLFTKAGRVDIPMPDITPEGMMPVNRALMHKGGQKQLVYYWFPQRGRILTSAYQLKLYAFWDALTRQRTDGALVRLITPLYDMEKLDQAEQRLKGFMREIVPVLNRFLPEK
jgi:exosortase D (VPLPA-CTERM-specific)